MKIQNLRDGNHYACKQMKQRFESIEQVNNLREIQALRRLNPHPNILTLHQVVFDRKSGSLALICELMDMNIYELIRGRRHPLSEKKVRHYMYQLCKSLDHMHRNGIFHRDVKPENILVKRDVLKLGDFGSCRSVYSKQPYTEYISTRWYRAPECLLTDGFYGFKMDLWSAGCVLYEMASLQPLFPGANELDQISRIHDVMGTPAEKTLTKFKQAAEKQALARARWKASAPFPECPTAPELSSAWQTAQEGRKQVQCDRGSQRPQGPRVSQADTLEAPPPARRGRERPTAKPDSVCTHWGWAPAPMAAALAVYQLLPQPHWAGPPIPRARLHPDPAPVTLSCPSDHPSWGHREATPGQVSPWPLSPAGAGATGGCCALSRCGFSCESLTFPFRP
uniref:Protein kinase domain-containing protein n=1 Tax=Bos indicus x Bos taurus TaxID=30522 RepID=A0A4W2C7X3_BOBOX